MLSDGKLIQTSSSVAHSQNQRGQLQLAQSQDAELNKLISAQETQGQNVQVVQQQIEQLNLDASGQPQKILIRKVQQQPQA